MDSYLNSFNNLILPPLQYSYYSSGHPSSFNTHSQHGYPITPSYQNNTSHQIMQVEEDLSHLEPVFEFTPTRTNRVNSNATSTSKPKKAKPKKATPPIDLTKPLSKTPANTKDRCRSCHVEKYKYRDGRWFASHDVKECSAECDGYDVCHYDFAHPDEAEAAKKMEQEEKNRQKQEQEDAKKKTQAPNRIKEITNAVVKPRSEGVQAQENMLDVVRQLIKARGTGATPLVDLTNTMEEETSLKRLRYAHMEVLMKFINTDVEKFLRIRNAIDELIKKENLTISELTSLIITMHDQN